MCVAVAAWATGFVAAEIRNHGVRALFSAVALVLILAAANAMR
jgi:hypothetical protein